MMILVSFVVFSLLALVAYIQLNHWKRRQQVKRASIIHQYLKQPLASLKPHEVPFYMPFVGRDDDAVQVERLKQHARILIYEARPSITTLPEVLMPVDERLEMEECACYIVDHEERLHMLWRCMQYEHINGKPLEAHVTHLGVLLDLPVDACF